MSESVETNPYMWA